MGIQLYVENAFAQNFEGVVPLLFSLQETVEKESPILIFICVCV